jgi:Tol biopolymer transport system component
VIRATVLAGCLLAATACGGGGNRSTTPVEHHLVYVAGPNAASTSIWVADVNGAHARRLGRGYSAVLSPDGRTVAVRRHSGIYLISSTGTRERRLTPRRLHPLAWSPDGNTIIASRPKQLAVIELDAIDRRSGRVRLIASGSLYGFDFSPKGDELVYSRAPTATGEGPCGDQFDLYVTKITGGTPSRLTHDGLSAFPPGARRESPSPTFQGGQPSRTARPPASGRSTPTARTTGP